MNVNTLRVLLVFALALTAVCVTANAEPEKDPPGKDSGFVPLFDGKSMKGWPVMTLLRGKVIVRDGNFVGEAGDGKFLRH